MAAELSGGGPALGLQGYGVAFGRRVILASVDAALPQAGVDVLMGPAGTGKSTLMRSLAGLNDANANFRSWGQATLCGTPIGGDWRPMLVHQHAAAMHGSVAEALQLHARRGQERSARAWADWARDCADRHRLGPLPAGGLDTPVLALPADLRRKVNILSHALAMPPMLFIDEPTYGLDDLAAERLIEWLRELARGQRMVVALHHQRQAARLADRIILMGGGRVLALDAARSFFARPPNAHAEQFVRTGSLGLPSPDALPEHLAEEAERPPALPPAATQAVRAAHAPAPAPAAAPAPPAPQPPELPQPRRRAVPPPTSASHTAVEDASIAGLVVLSESRGPRGFHWIVPGKLAGCPQPGVAAPIDYDLDLLAHVGISDLITLTEQDLDQEALGRHGLRNLHLPIYDREAPSLPQAYMLVKRMQQLLEAGGVLAVHCKAGIGRTGTVLACWLVREGGLSADTAIERLRRINRAYVQTTLQEEFIRAFEADILRRL